MPAWVNAALSTPAGAEDYAVAVAHDEDAKAEYRTA